MKAAKPFLLIGFLLLWAGCVQSADLELASFISRVEEQAKKIKSFQCKFIQERHLAIFSKPLCFHGTLFLVRPDRLRWEFVSPLRSVLILNKEKGLKCDDSVVSRKFDLQSDPVMHQAARQLRAWLDGAYTRLQQEYDMTLVGPETLQLRPKVRQMQKVVNTIEIKFDKTLQPAWVEIMETDGSRTVITFSDYLLNVDPADSLFETCLGESR